MSNAAADDGDDSPAPAAAPKAAAPAPAAAPKAAPKAVRGDYPGRGGPRKVYQGDREVNGDVPAGEDSKDDRARSFGGRGAARGGRGAGRGGRGGANPRSNGGTYLGGDRPRRENGGGRPFDRQSQTGHKDSDKAEGQGWGAEEGKKELEAETLGEADAKVEGTPVEGAATPVKGDSTPARIEEEEDNSLTYDEYLAAQAGKKLNIALPTARAANEGADDSAWSSGVQLVKKGEQTTDEWLASTKKEQKAAKEKKTKTFLEVEFSSKPPRRDGPVREGGREGGRGGRGGRGRGEGRGRGGAAPRGAPRAPRAAAAPVNLDDASAFPTL